MLKVRSVFLLPREGTGNPGGTASTLSDRGGGGCVDCPLTQRRSLGNIRRSGLAACPAWGLAYGSACWPTRTSLQDPGRSTRNESCHPGHEAPQPESVVASLPGCYVLVP